MRRFPAHYLGRPLVRPDFGRLALPHLEALYRTARRLTARAAEAEDLVQQTYLEAQRSFHRLRDADRCRAWLFRILHNLWFHQRRRAGPAAWALRGEQVDPAGPADPEDAVVGLQYSDEVELALRRLPAEFRTALLLAVVEGLSYEEVAEIMGCPKGTVRSRVARGRALLAAELVGLRPLRAARARKGAP